MATYYGGWKNVSANLGGTVYNNRMRLGIVASESNINKSNNTSDVIGELFLYIENSSGWTITATNKGILTIDADQSSGSVPNTIKITEQGYKIATLTKKNIKHNNDGSKTISLSGTFTSSISGIGTIPTVSVNMELTDIIRASTIKAEIKETIEDGAIPSKMLLSLTHYNDDYYTNLSYGVNGNYVMFVNNFKDTSYEWEVPYNDILNLFPDSNKADLKLEVETYDSKDEYIGTVEISISLDISNVFPSFTTIMETDSTTNNLTGKSDRVIKGISSASLNFSEIDKLYGAIIKKYGFKSSTTQTIIESETLPLKLDVNSLKGIDYTAILTTSRGTYEYLLDLETIEYIVPTYKDQKIERVEDTSKQMILQFNGDWCNENFGEVTNSLDISLSYKLQNSNELSSPIKLTPIIDGNKYAINHTTEQLFDDYNYYIYITIKDSTGYARTYNEVLVAMTDTFYMDNEKFEFRGTINAVGEDAQICVNGIPIDGGGGGEGINAKLDTRGSESLMPALEPIDGVLKLHKSAKTGSFEDLTDKPEIPDVSDLVNKQDLQDHIDNSTVHVTEKEKKNWDNKQSELTENNFIKINNETIFKEGNIDLQKITTLEGWARITELENGIYYLKTTQPEEGNPNFSLYYNGKISMLPLDLGQDQILHVQRMGGGRGQSDVQWYMFSQDWQMTEGGVYEWNVFVYGWTNDVEGDYTIFPLDKIENKLNKVNKLTPNVTNDQYVGALATYEAIQESALKTLKGTVSVTTLETGLYKLKSANIVTSAATPLNIFGGSRTGLMYINYLGGSSYNEAWFFDTGTFDRIQKVRFIANATTLNQNYTLNIQVINNLTSTSVTNPLSANQGRILNDFISAVQERVTNLEEVKVLYDITANTTSATTDNSTITLSEDINNFKKIRVYTGSATTKYSGALEGEVPTPITGVAREIFVSKGWLSTSALQQHITGFKVTNATTLTVISSAYYDITTPSTRNKTYIWKIEGIR